MSQAEMLLCGPDMKLVPFTFLFHFYDHGSIPPLCVLYLLP